MIYHVTTLASWEQAKALGYYEAPSLHTEGFIHLSQAHQVAGVLLRYYKGMRELLLLHVEEALLDAPLKYEHSPSVGESFPHVFGRINLSAITKTETLADQI